MANSLGECLDQWKYSQLPARSESFVLVNAEGLDFSAYPQSKDELHYVAQCRTPTVVCCISRCWRSDRC